MCKDSLGKGCSVIEDTFCGLNKQYGVEQQHELHDASFEY